MDQRYLVITGASSGIGLETASVFSHHNWTVINLSRRPCPDPRVKNISVDLAMADGVDSIAEKIMTLLPDKALISLVHNAACLQKDSMQDVDMSRLRHVMEVNIIAPIAINQYLIPRMIAGSSIIYIGSTLSEKAVRNAASYSVSKHASIGMMRATCQDLAGTGIHTACLCPGFTETDMLKRHMNGHIDPVIGKNCFNRLIQPAEMAAAILSTATSPVFNGAVLHANMGQIEN